MAQINYHPAPGLTGILPGWFVVPQNPIQPETYQPGIGEIIGASFVVPQNPIADYTTGRPNFLGKKPGAPARINGKPVSSCGCGGACASCSGLGNIQADLQAISDKVSAGQWGDAIQSPLFGIPLWGILAGVAAATLMLGGRRR
jgi:hypothetical protein